VTGDAALLRIYEEGRDVHKITAAAILKLPIDQVGKEQRQLAVIFGLLYGQGAKGLAAYAQRQYGVEMTEEEAEKHRKNLFRTYKGLRQWQRNTGNLTQITKKVRTPFGRIRDFSREHFGIYLYGSS
jgi:DNA polymerase-1